MSSYVLDSCVVAKLILHEEGSGRAFEIMNEFLRLGIRPAMLDLARIEVTNVLWKSYRRRLVSSDRLAELFELLVSLPFEIERTDLHLKEALRIGTSFDCAIYDALFVAVAASKNLQGVTTDEKLYRSVHKGYPSIRLLRDFVL